MNKLYRCDAKDVSAKGVALAYVDPPFSTGRVFSKRGSPDVAYTDVWKSKDDYLDWITPRLAHIETCLLADATFWIHLDQRIIHELKCWCDNGFAKLEYVGEVIWLPGNGSKAKRGPGVTHQTILIYGKGNFTWNSKAPQLRAPYAATSLGMHFTNNDGDGRLYRKRIIDGKVYKYFADEGRSIGSVWVDCPSMQANSPLFEESTGYPTQKPLKLLDRIIRAASVEGDTVLDAFCGSGTTLEAAAIAGRKFVGCDIGVNAITIASKRLTKWL